MISGAIAERAIPLKLLVLLKSPDFQMEVILHLHYWSGLSPSNGLFAFSSRWHLKNVWCYTFCILYIYTYIDEPWEGRNTCLWIYIYYTYLIYIYIIYIYNIYIYIYIICYMYIFVLINVYGNMILVSSKLQLFRIPSQYHGNMLMILKTSGYNCVWVFVSVFCFSSFIIPLGRR